MLENIDLSNLLKPSQFSLDTRHSQCSQVFLVLLSWLLLSGLQTANMLSPKL